MPNADDSKVAGDEEEEERESDGNESVHLDTERSFGEHESEMTTHKHEAGLRHDQMEFMGNRKQQPSTEWRSR